MPAEFPASGFALETTLTAIRGFVDGLEGYTDGLEALVTALNGYVDGLEAGQTAGTTELQAIKGHVDGLEGAFTTLNAKDFATQTTLAALLAKVIAAPSTEAKQDAANTLLTAIAASVDGLEGFTDGLEALATTLNGYVDGLEGKDFATQTTLAALLAKVIAAPATEAKQDTAIGHLDGLEAAHAADLAKLETIRALLAATLVVESTTAKTIKFAKIDTATSGAGNTIVAAVASKKITVLAYSFVVSGAVTVKWVTGVSADLSGAMSFSANGGISKAAPNLEVPLLQTVSGEALKMTLGGAVQVSGELTYYEA